MSESRQPSTLRDTALLTTALLTTVKTAGKDGVAKTLCFGNILELGSDSLVLESKRELTAGDLLVLDVVFPGIRSGPKSVVSLGCVVEGERDSIQLHYELGIDKMCDDACRQLAEFLSQRRFERPV